MDIWNKKPRRLSEIWKLDGETNMVIALGLKGVVKLNCLASAIWLRLDGQHTIGCILSELVKTYKDQDQRQLEIDIMAFFSYLIDNHLVVMDWHPLHSELPYTHAKS